MHLKEAIDLDVPFPEMARSDSDFANVRCMPEFARHLGVILGGPRAEGGILTATSTLLGRAGTLTDFVSASLRSVVSVLIQIAVRPCSAPERRAWPQQRGSFALSAGEAPRPAASPVRPGVLLQSPLCRTSRLGQGHLRGWV
jgi:hypothetical protein